MTGLHYTQHALCTPPTLLHLPLQAHLAAEETTPSWLRLDRDPT